MQELSPLHTKKHPGFKALRKTISKRLRQIQDPRTGAVDYILHNCFMSGFAMMFFQDQSLLQFQQRLQKRLNRNNLKNLFQISAIPKDSQLRQVLDDADNAKVYELFADLFRALQRGRHLELFRFSNDAYLLCLDGSGYFSSDTIHCPGCLTKTSNGRVRYEHQILQLTDRPYQQCRSSFGSRIEFWNQLRCTIRVFIFADFDHLLAFVTDPESRPP